MEIIVVLLILAFVVLLFLPTPQPTRRYRCELHDWAWKENGYGGDYMICSRCGYVPGTEELSGKE